uniref:Ribonuclease H-like domain-containing protein n=1 Tax=Tanacetum cinerariifolium TaxID=118510 RepID=A0A6L2JUN6_TANCI|nr:ribonuclease H-like domain-containing protein [Tanacetum cinerariifolium]
MLKHSVHQSMFRHDILGAVPCVLPSAFSTMVNQDSTWNMDTSALSHLNSHTSNLNTVYNKCLYPSACVGDGKSIHVTNIGHSILPTLNRPLHLHNALITPNIIKIFIFVRQFTGDNDCTVEFNAFGFSVKDFLTSHILLRCDSSGDLYPVTSPSPTPHALFSVSPGTWHQRRGHPGEESHVAYLPLPKSPSVALSDPHWRDVMYDEYNSLIKNDTWILIPKLPNVNVVRSMWLFRHKYHADGSLSRYKARLVANGRNQQYGVDCSDTFSLVVKPATIRTVLSLALAWNWPVHQLDVKNAFLNGDLTETVYMYQPSGFVDSRFPHHVTLSRSSAEAEYRGVANVVAEIAWIQNLLRELHNPLFTATLVYCDNVSTVYMSTNPVQYQRTKHIEIDIHFVHDMVARGQDRKPSPYDIAKIYEKHETIIALEGPFTAHTTDYLADGIYPTWSTFVKTYIVARTQGDLNFKRLKKVQEKMSNGILVSSKVNKLQVMGTLDGRILKSYHYKDLHALYFGILAMSSDNAQSTVTYMSTSSDSDGPSWGIPLMNAELKHPEYHASSDDDIQVEDDDEDPEEDPNEEHEPIDDDEDPEEDPNEEHELEDEDTKEPTKGSDETEPFEEDETAVTPPPSRHRGERISFRPQTPMAASTKALIDAFAVGSSLFPLPPTNPAYDQELLGHMTAMIRMRDDIPEEDMPPLRRFVFTTPPPGCDVAESFAAAARAPRGQYDIVDTVEAGQGLIRSPSHDTQTIPRAADRAEDVGYVRALQAFEQRMMTSIEEVNLRVSYKVQVRRQESKYFYTQLHDAQTDRKDIRLKIDVVRGQRTAYETKLQEVHQAYLSSEARNKELLARIETLETHVSRIEWKSQSAKDLIVTLMMCIHALEARARTDVVEDANSSC